MHEPTPIGHIKASHERHMTLNLVDTTPHPVDATPQSEDTTPREGRSGVVSIELSAISRWMSVVCGGWGAVLTSCAPDSRLRVRRGSDLWRLVYTAERRLHPVQRHIGVNQCGLGPIAAPRTRVASATGHRERRMQGNDDVDREMRRREGVIRRFIERMDAALRCSLGFLCRTRGVTIHLTCMPGENGSGVLIPAFVDCGAGHSSSL